jgi:hypothetical protein
MPTKPVATFTHATDANFTAGPAATFPTKLPVPFPAQGFVPGQGISAEQVNQLMNTLGDWITNWIALGSATGTLDAHLVETNAFGTSSISALVLGATANTINPLRIPTGNSGDPSLTSAFIGANDDGGKAIHAVGASNSTPAVLIEQSGNGRGLECSSDNGEGGRFTGGANLTGLVAVGGPLGGNGVTGQGLAGGYGVSGVAGPTGGGVIAIGVPTSTAPALSALGGLFPALQERGTFFMQPTPGDPNNPNAGDFWKTQGAAGAGRGRLRWVDADGAPNGGGIGTQTAWSTTNGLGFYYEETEGSQTTGALLLQVAETLEIDPANTSPGNPEGYYIVEWYAEISLAVGTALPTRAVVAAFDGPVEIARAEYDFAALGQFKIFSGFRRRSYSGALKSFTIRFATLSAGEDVTIRRARIVARGAFEDSSI